MCLRSFAVVPLIVVGFGACGSDTTAPPEDAYSDFTWLVSTPQAQGVDGALLDSADRWIRDSLPNVNAFLLIRNGVIVGEHYYYLHDSTAASEIHSITKSFVGTFVGIALRQGWIASLDERVPAFFPKIFEDDTLDARKRDITVRHLLTMSSGLDFERTATLPADQGERIRHILGSPLAFDPGTAYLYDGGNPHVLSAMITRRTGLALGDLGTEHLFGPLNIRRGGWVLDPDGTSNGGTGMSLTARGMAKLGQLYLQDGVWEGERILPAGWVAQTSAVSFELEPEYFANYGYQFWITE